MRHMWVCGFCLFSVLYKLTRTCAVLSTNGDHRHSCSVSLSTLFFCELEDSGKFPLWKWGESLLHLVFKKFLLFWNILNFVKCYDLRDCVLYFAIIYYVHWLQVPYFSEVGLHSFGEFHLVVYTRLLDVVGLICWDFKICIHKRYCSMILFFLC